MGHEIFITLIEMLLVEHFNPRLFLRVSGIAGWVINPFLDPIGFYLESVLLLQ